MNHIIPCDARTAMRGRVYARCGAIVVDVIPEGLVDCEACLALDASDEAGLASLLEPGDAPEPPLCPRCGFAVPRAFAPYCSLSCAIDAEADR